MPDYEAMSGADFQREVGTDPVKWADAAMRSVAAAVYMDDREERVALLAKWFADAMDAARENPISEVVG